MQSKNDKPKSIHYTNAITNSYNEESKAQDVVAVNNLVPARYGKVQLTYSDNGQGTGNVEKAEYFSNGAYQETRITCTGDSTGSAHKTSINFENRTSESLAGTSFVIYDNIGAVQVWFNVDFNNNEPVNPAVYRSIEVNILSTHSASTIANRVSQAIDLDSAFLAISSTTFVIISSSSVGIKENSYDINTQLSIKNTSGIEPLSLNNKYFYINSATNADNYYVWYNVSGVGQDPAIPNKTGLMVNIPSGASPETVAENTKLKLDSTGKFITNIDSEILLITNCLIGTTDLASEETTNFVVFTPKLGENRELIVTLVMSYDIKGNIVSVERL